jgi:hypothetical protein
MKRTALALTLILVLLVSAVAGTQFANSARGNLLLPPPHLDVLSPSPNGTYQSNVALKVAVSLSRGTLGWLGYTLDGKADVGIFVSERSDNIVGSGTLYGLSDGWHGLLVRGATSLNESFQEMVFFVVDTVPPNVSVLSVENKTYYSVDFPLNFSVNKPFSWVAYNLDNQANVTVDGNTTLTGLSEGSHSIIVYANDTVGNIGSSQTTYFNIAKEPEPTPTPTSQPEPLPTTLVAVASGASVTVVCVGLLLFYLKRRNAKSSA